MSSKSSELIKQSLINLNHDTPVNKEIYADNTNHGSNEFLFFIKPELTQKANSSEFDLILDLILSKIDQTNLKIKNIRVLNAIYLDKYNVIAQHYGVINKISSNLKDNLTEEGTKRFKEIYNLDFHKTKALGSIEFLKEFPYFEPTGLDYLWQNSPVEKLAGGTYIQKLSFDGLEIFLANGFHPRQLEHFTKPGRSIVTFTLTGEMDWSAARNNLIGKTNPADAKSGSIRKELLENKEKFNLQAVNSSWNGVHLSAGPIEGLIELMRYNSDFISGKSLNPDNFNFGRRLISEFGSESTEYILSNPDIEVDDSKTSVFDYTEEKNSQESLMLLKTII